MKSISIYDYGAYLQLPDLPGGINVIVHEQLPPVTAEMATWPRESRPKMGPGDASQYLFTSGTTGLPKAATFPAGFCHMASSPYRWPLMFEKKRRLYACTPMFHGGAT
jgi:acyl-coenzyme A synthetase/AMP-(fatty) acid ligase